MEAAIGTNLLDRNTADRLLAETDLPSLRDPGGVSEGKLGDTCGPRRIGKRRSGKVAPKYSVITAEIGHESILLREEKHVGSARKITSEEDP